MDIHRLKRLWTAASLLLVLVAPGLAQAAQPRLTLQQIELNQKNWPKGRAYINLVGSNGMPIPGLGMDLFRVYEDGAKASSKLLKVETLDSVSVGASIVVVVQASGAMVGVKDEIKKSVAAFINGLKEKDQVAVVAYGETADVVATFGADKGEVAGKANKIEFQGKSFLLYDGIQQALQLNAPTGGKAGAKQVETSLPTAKAIIVISDGRDNGSATDVEKIVSDASKAKIPIHAVGHSEMDQETLRALEDLAHRTGGTYHAAPGGEDISKGLTKVKEFINQMYVIDWKSSLPHDGHEHAVAVAFENEGSNALKAEMRVKTPDFTDWIKIGIIAAAILLVLVIIAVIYLVTRPKPPPQRFCPVCKRVQMPEWDICLFCLKAAKARVQVQKGAQKGKIYPLVGKVVNIGSGPENGIRLMDGGISGKHAGIAIDDTKFEIVDLGSKNGVLVNGKKTPRRFLRNGDIITLGLTELKFEASVGAASGGDDEAED